MRDQVDFGEFTYFLQTQNDPITQPGYAVVTNQISFQVLAIVSSERNLDEEEISKNPNSSVDRVIFAPDGLQPDRHFQRQFRAR